VTQTLFARGPNQATFFKIRQHRIEVALDALGSDIGKCGSQSGEDIAGKYRLIHKPPQGGANDVEVINCLTRRVGQKHVTIDRLLHDTERP